jgi:hypothetical protein
VSSRVAELSSAAQQLSSQRSPSEDFRAERLSEEPANSVLPTPTMALSLNHFEFGLWLIT